MQGHAQDEESGEGKFCDQQDWFGRTVRQAFISEHSLMMERSGGKIDGGERRGLIGTDHATHEHP